VKKKHEKLRKTATSPVTNRTQRKQQATSRMAEEDVRRLAEAEARRLLEEEAKKTVLERWATTKKVLI
jgi:hypothetical protein